MYRTVVFNSTFPNEWKFDENENPSAPGARELAETIVAKLRPRVASVSEVEQHEYYGWGFTTTLQRGTFYNVLNPADDCYLTVSMDWYALKAILRQRPRQPFERYCDALVDALREISEVSNVRWEAYRR
jgi:hypothetical protein